MNRAFGSKAGDGYSAESSTWIGECDCFGVFVSIVSILRIRFYSDSSISVKFGVGSVTSFSGRATCYRFEFTWTC